MKAQSIATENFDYQFFKDLQNLFGKKGYAIFMCTLIASLAKLEFHLLNIL